MKKTIGIISLLTLLFVLVACQSETTDDDSTPQPEPVGETVEETEETTIDPAVDELPSNTANIEIGFEEIQAGTGETPVEGDIIRLHYVGTLEDGTVFDSSRDRGEPMEMMFGRSSLITGFSDGIGRMTQGMIANITIPPELGYGAQGSGQIPPNATINFEIEILSIEKAPTVQTFDEEYVVMESGVQYYEYIPSDSTIAPNLGDTALLSFTVWFEDGTWLGGTEGQPYSYRVGRDPQLNGWEDGIVGMPVGSHRQIVIPPEVAFGEEVVASPQFDGGALVIEAELLEVTFAPTSTPVDEADYTTLDSGVKVYDFIVGDGESPEINDTVIISFNVWLVEDGSWLGGSHSGSSPFILGTGDLAEGWELGMLDMEVGGMRQIVVPSELAYGEEGGRDIPPNSSLLIEVELLNVQPAPEPAVFPADFDEDAFEELESGLKYLDITVGEGNVAETGNNVSVHYAGWLLDGTEFDSSIPRNSTFSFMIGSGQVIKGWDEGLVGMQEGGVRLLLIPSELAYGEFGSPPIIGPDETLLFEVRLVDIVE